jgi:hypothetical protein
LLLTYYALSLNCSEKSVCKTDVLNKVRMIHSQAEREDILSNFS